MIGHHISINEIEAKNTVQEAKQQKTAGLHIIQDKFLKYGGPH